MRRLLTILTCVLLVTACGKDSTISRDYRCFFVFDTSLHPLPCQLTGIVGSNGHFMQVSMSYRQGVNHLHTVRNYDNATDDVVLSTAKENQVSYSLGANNSIIIGTSSYDFVLLCFDGQCANCMETYGGTSYPLTWSNNGLRLYCAKCKRSYDVNNGVVADGEPGRQLYRYQAALDGPVLRAWN